MSYKIKKYHLFPLLFFFLSLQVSAQPFWNRVLDDSLYNKSHVVNAAYFRDSLILVSGSVSDASCPWQILFAFDRYGRMLWNVEGAHDVIYAGADHIYTAGYPPTGDVIGNEQVIFSKYDRQGHQLFSIGYPEVPHDYYFQFEPKSIDISQDGTVIIASGETAVKSDTGGSQIREYALPVRSPATGILALSPTRYLITTDTALYKSDSAFALLDSVSFPDTLRQAVLKNDTLYLLFDSVLMRQDTLLTVLDSLVAGRTERFLKMNFYGEELWIRATCQDSIKLYRIRHMMVRETLRFPRIADVRDFFVTDSNYVFAGNSYSGQIALYGCPATPLPGPVSGLPDIEMIDFNIDSIVPDYTGQGGTYLRGYWFNTEMTVRNNGADTVRSFAVYADLWGGMFCSQNFFYQQFSNTLIPPGDTVTFDLKRAYQGGQTNTFCFECLAPDGKIETETGNNLLCKIFDIVGIRRTPETIPRVYPNPAGDRLTIEGRGAGIERVVLTDMTGRVVLSGSYAPARQIILNLSGLTEGLYILKTESGGKSASQIIVKK